MKSILSNERECYICGSPVDLHKHHIYGGSGRRQVSEREGCWVYLCANHHNMSSEGVHFNKELDTSLKQDCQLRWEQLHEHDLFTQTFGRNYL